jgi:hypothetical protein
MARPPLNTPRTEQAPALEAWPPAPDGMSPGEVLSWERLGVALIAGRTVTTADLLIAEEAARVMARIRQLYADEDLKATTLKAWLDLLTKMLGELGLSPRSRKNIQAPAPAAKANPLAGLLDG